MQCPETPSVGANPAEQSIIKPVGLVVTRALHSQIRESLIPAPLLRDLKRALDRHIQPRQSFRRADDARMIGRDR